MPNRNQPDRWESSLLAGVMAVVGSIFLLDRLGILTKCPVISMNQAVSPFASVFLVLIGLTLLIASDPKR